MHNAIGGNKLSVNDLEKLENCYLSSDYQVDSTAVQPIQRKVILKQYKNSAATYILSDLSS